MEIQRKRSLSPPVLHLLLPFPCCHLKPWRRPAVSSNLKRINEKRPRSDILFHVVFLPWKVKDFLHYTNNLAVFLQGFSGVIMTRF